MRLRDFYRLPCLITVKGYCMAPSGESAASGGPAAQPLKRAAQVLVVSSVMFTFIGFWRTAAIVLCDMSSTVYYIGAIVESAIGKCAPWFILAVLLFSYAMRAVYIESSALFVRGGVYRVVKEAMGGFLAKVSVSALLFDYVLTGPISGVSAGQYIVGLGLETISRYTSIHLDEGTRQAIKSTGSVLIACLITLYFFRQNLIGIPESSDKALKIMIATTVMGVILLVWSVVTLAAKGPVNDIPTWKPDLTKKTEIGDSGQVVPKINPLTGEQEDPLGFLPRVSPSFAESLRAPASWLSLVGIVGLVLAFGHSILAMSGEETLAQVYREVESPKLLNFKKAAFIVFLYSFLLTGTMNVLALLLIPDDLRMKEYYDNWMGGLAMQLIGPVSVRLLLNAFVVAVGFLILAGAVNTSIIGSNGVLSRVAEDGVLPDWFLKPHHRFGTTSRILWLITGLQLFTIVVSRGDVILLGEAYAFGVVWSFVFKTLSMVMLRFKDRTPREFKVPFNVRVGDVEVPIGLGLIFLVMFLSALANFITKQVATISGLIFTTAFLAVFISTETYYEKRRRGAKHEHLEQFNREIVEEVATDKLDLTKPFRKLVAIRSPQNLFMLEKSLAETDPDTTEVVVMTAKVTPRGSEAGTGDLDLDRYDQQLMTAVVERAERAGKQVKPLIMRTNSPLHAVVKAAKDLQAQELVIGASNKFTAEDQLDQVAFYWMQLNDGPLAPLTVRILGRNRDVYFDLGGGNRIPRIGERKARSVEELRALGVGVDRVLLVHEGTLESSDLFEAVLTMLDPDVHLGLLRVPDAGESVNGMTRIDSDVELSKKLGRAVQIHGLGADLGTSIVRIAGDSQYDLVIVALSPEFAYDQTSLSEWVKYVLKNTPCRVFLAGFPTIPREVEEELQGTGQRRC
jgi:amino acid transporter/nucleotide-binding universal stress UspA family protein